MTHVLVEIVMNLLCVALGAGVGWLTGRNRKSEIDE